MRQINAPAYHHGNLRRAIIDAALEAIGESGPSGWSLRELARRAGVSHAAPVHHFKDKAGLFTAIAAEGYELFAAELERAAGDFLEAGVAYVRFATTHRPYVLVMFRPELYRTDDPRVAAARERAGAVLREGARALAPDPARERAFTVGAWSAVHGLADLWLSGALPESAHGDAESVARSMLQAVFDRPHRPGSGA